MIEVIQWYVTTRASWSQGERKIMPREETIKKFNRLMAG